MNPPYTPDRRIGRKMAPVFAVSPRCHMDKPDGGEELVARIHGGDPAAEEEFARFFAPRVRVMIQTRTRNPEVARELTQDVLLSALKALRSGALREPGSLAGFIHGIARNIVNAHIRSQFEQVEVPLDTEIGAAHPFDDQDLEGAAAVREALTFLRDGDREILIMTLVEGLKPGEIAKRSGLDPAVVRQRKSRAILRIREILGRNGKRPS